MEKVKAALKDAKVIPVVILEDEEKAVPLAKKLLENGTRVIEITFRTAAAEASIRRIKAECPEMVIGAGTILTEDELNRAIQAGVSFCVSPGLDTALVQKAQSKNMPFIPGISTASELTAALNIGCKTVKFFPAEAAGGIPMLKSLMAAFGHCGVTVMPTGGITETSADAWFNVKGVLCVGGSWMINPILKTL